MVCPVPLSSPEKKMPKQELAISPTTQRTRIIATAAHPPAVIAAMTAFVPAIAALAAETVALAVLRTVWAAALAEALTVCTAFGVFFAAALAACAASAPIGGGFTTMRPVRCTGRAPVLTAFAGLGVWGACTAFFGLFSLSTSLHFCICAFALSAFRRASEKPRRPRFRNWKPSSETVPCAVRSNF